MQPNVERVIVMQSNVARVLDKPDDMVAVFTVDQLPSWTAADDNLMLVAGEIADGTHGTGIASPVDDAFINQVKNGEALAIAIGTDDNPDVIHANLNGASDAINIALSHCIVASTPDRDNGFIKEFPSLVAELFR